MGLRILMKCDMFPFLGERNEMTNFDLFKKSFRVLIEGVNFLKLVYN